MLITSDHPLAPELFTQVLAAIGIEPGDTTTVYIGTPARLRGTPSIVSVDCEYTTRQRSSNLSEHSASSSLMDYEDRAVDLVSIPDYESEPMTPAVVNHQLTGFHKLLLRITPSLSESDRSTIFNWDNITHISSTASGPSQA